MSHPEVEIMEQVPTNRFPTWPPAQNLPMNPPITVVFKGLAAFRYNSQGWCEVGFHRADGRHRLDIKVFKNGTHFPLDLPPLIGTLSLGVRIGGQEKPPSVYFLKNGGDDDFRWTLDFQGDEFYPDVFETIEVFSAKLFVRHGIFFTQKRTRYALDRIGRSFPFIETPLNLGLRRYPLGHPAEVIATGIYLEGDEYVSLVINGQEVVRLPETAGAKYEICFSHECKENNENCPFKFDHWLESRRNDFHFHRDVLVLPFLKTRYSVVLSEGQEIERVNTISDEAPCMGAGFGGGGSL